MTGHVEDLRTVPVILQWSLGADAGTYLAVVTAHQRVGNDTFVVGL